MTILAYKTSGRGEACKAHLLGQACVYGFEPAQVEQMHRPVLARLLDKAPANLQALA